MLIPRVLRKQLQCYEAAGFTVRDVEPSRGSHFKVWFQQFSAPQFLTVNATEPRAIKNNIARFRRLCKGTTQ
jgi:hypothetical protein